MYIKVIDTDEAEIREVDVIVNVVQNADNHILSADTKTVSADLYEFAISYKSNSCAITTPIGKFAISYTSNSCTLITPIEHCLEIKDWKDTRYKTWIPVNNRNSLWDWWYYTKLLLVFGNVGVYIDSREHKLEIYVNESMSVYIDEKPVVIERSDTCISK